MVINQSMQCIVEIRSNYKETYVSQSICLKERKVLVISRPQATNGQLSHLWRSNLP